MEWIEVSARSLEEAKELALDRLGVVEDELEFEVLQDAKGGVLGFGRVDARIRARVRPISREKPSDRRRRNRPARGGRDGARRRGSREGASSAADADGADGAGRAEARNEGGARSNRSPRRRRSRGAGGATVAAPVSRPDQEDSTVDHDDLSIEEQASSARDFASGLVQAFDLEASVEVTIGDDAVDVTVDGSDLGILVGPKGATLAAIEELTRAVVQHATSGQSARIHVDVAGYRQRRREALAEFTRGLAEQVRASGEERALEPMSPPDRKVVHDTVAEIDGVTTASVGEDTRRRVVIRPE
ncbi:MAG TPA: RNA-binding cell elongation regulator Jag/EloR [Acidimicrobiia bacterium]|nr:RNA-binding cell elongation regulator Jag/EloR [Acidimicrobiia bacterium]